MTRKPLADAFLARDHDHLWLAHDRRSRQHKRDPRVVRQGPNTDLARRARRRDEDLPRAMRQNGRCAPIPLSVPPSPFSSFILSQPTAQPISQRVVLMCVSCGFRHVRRRPGRRTLQRSPLRAHPPARAANHRRLGTGRDGGQDERGPDDDGFPSATARHGARRALRVSRADARRRVSLPPMRRETLRRADRLRRLRSHDRVVPSSCAELSSLVPRQALHHRVSFE